MTMFTSTIRCPVCGAVFDVQTHPDPKPHAQSVAMLANPGRREHAEESPACTESPLWIRGWTITTTSDSP